jgi:hypothetical protein
MLHVTAPNMPETLTYAVLAALGIDLLLVVLLAVRSDGLGMLLLATIGIAGYWLFCRQMIALITARLVAAVGAILLFLGGLVYFAASRPYHGILFVIAAAAFAFVFVLLQQGMVPAELRIGNIVVIGASSRGALLRMLEELRDAGVLTADEFTAKRLLLGL